MKYIKKLLYYCSAIFTREENLYILYLSFLSAVLAVMEIATIGGLVPLVNMFARGQTQINNKYIQVVINQFHLTGVKNHLLLLGIFLIIISVLKMVFNMIFIRRRTGLAVKIQTRLSVLLLKNYTLNNYEFHVGTNSSVLLKNITVETSNIYFFIGSLMTLIANAIMISGILVLLLLVSVKITLFTIVFFVIIAFLIVKFTNKKMRDLGYKRENIAKLTYKLAHQTLNAIKEIKINKVENFFVDRFSKIASEMVSLGTEVITLGSLPRYVLEVVIYVGAISFLLISTFFFHIDKNFFGILIAYLAATYKLMPSFSNVTTSISEIRYLVPALEIVTSAVKESKPKEGAMTYNKTDLVSTLCIKLADIGYGYNSENGNNKILQGINLIINRGDKIAIVGESGEGKSTLVNIITGLIKPVSGEITFNGIQLDKIDPCILSKNLGYIPQDAVILDSDIVANVAFGLPDNEIDKDRIKKILRVVRLEKFCEDLNYPVGEDGNRLSGGERQRVVIARALYKNPRIIILDEITSALDSKTEADIIEDVLDIFSDKTLLVITHSVRLTEKFGIVYRIENKNISRVK